jgi:acyl-CoA thioesterase-1
MRSINLVLLVAALAGVALTGCSRRVPIPSGTIAFLGDSLTAGYGLDPSQAYPSLIAINGMTTVNLGVSGSKTEDGLRRLKAYFDSGGDPRLVVIALGANDILQGVDRGETEANLRSAIQVCRDHHVPILLCGIKIPFKWAAEGMFQKVADETHVPLLPDLMQGEETEPTYLQDDGMHPNVAGQKIIAEKMQEALLKDFSFK